MNEIKDKLLWIFLILPGFLAFTILSASIDVEIKHEFEIISLSLAITLAILFISSSLLKIASLAITLNDRNRKLFFFSSVLVLTIVAGPVLAYMKNRNYLFRIYSSIPFLDAISRVSNDPPLIFLLKNNTAGEFASGGDGRPGEKVDEVWARVELESGNLIEGWPEFYSQSGGEVQLYLSPACRINIGEDEEKAASMKGPGMYLQGSVIKTIEFIDRESSPCYRNNFPE